MSDIFKTSSKAINRISINESSSDELSVRFAGLEFGELPPRQAAYFRWKYRADRILAAILLIVLSPVILVLVAAVRLTSPGPGLYRQERLGERGRRFTIIKLRSMRNDAENGTGPKWATKNDDRATPIGRWLRKLHLDELTQLWNVVRGEMSLVGPRPERPEISEVLEPVIDRYYDRLLVRPGVTGLAQINLPPDQTLEDAIRKQILDLDYIETAGPWLDARMLMATGLRMIGIRGEAVMRMMFVCRRHLVRHVRDVDPKQITKVELPIRDSSAWRLREQPLNQHEIFVDAPSPMSAMHERLPRNPR